MTKHTSCPFCGGADILSERDGVHCEDCGGSAPSLAAWNRRAYPFENAEAAQASAWAAEDTANARLMAAAPELLEALAAIVDRLSAWEEGARISGDDNARVNYSLLCGTAYAAIAKATGGSI